MKDVRALGAFTCIITYLSLSKSNNKTWTQDILNSESGFLLLDKIFEVINFYYPCEWKNKYNCLTDQSIDTQICQGIIWT
jgi:hypothetical protein